MGLPWICNHTTIHSIAKDCASIALVLVDCALIHHWLQYEANSGAIGDICLQFVDYSGFCCNPFNILAILHSFAISPQFNLILSIAVRIGTPRSLGWLCPGSVTVDCSLTPLWLRLWGNPGTIVGIWLQPPKQSIRIVSGLPWICNRSTIHRIAKYCFSIVAGLRRAWKGSFCDCGALRGLRRTAGQGSGQDLESGLQPEA